MPDVNVGQMSQENASNATENPVLNLGKELSGIPGKVESAAQKTEPVKVGEPQKSDGHAWPDDWRERMVSHVTDEKSREKELKQLQRYGSPEEVHKKARSLESKLSSGELKATLSKDASPEQITSWRKENGIPELPTGYDLNLGDGVKFSAEDKPVIDGFLEQAHKTNQTAEQVKTTLKAFHAYLENKEVAQYQKDVETNAANAEILREDWGPEFKRNTNLINGLISSKVDETFSEQFWQARLPDGTRIADSPPVLKMLLNLALVDNPAGTVIPNSTGNLTQSVDSEIGAIEKAMRTDRKAYDKDEAMQERYRQLLGARETMKKRSK